MYDKANSIHDKINQYNLQYFCSCCSIAIGCILALLIIIPIFLGFGFSLSYGINENKYNMTTGKSFGKSFSKPFGESVQHDTNTTCYYAYNMETLFGCSAYGACGIIILYAFVFICSLIIFSYHKMRKNDIYDDKQNADDLYCCKLWLGFEGLMIIIVTYFITIIFGLIFTILAFGKEYNTYTGWSLNDNYSDQLLCYNNLKFAFFVGCLAPGIISWGFICLLFLLIAFIMLIFVYCKIWIHENIVSQRKSDDMQMNILKELESVD